MNELHSSVKPADPFTQPFRVVLHRSPTTGKWVTHIENVVQVGTGYQSKLHPDYYWGRYFENDYVSAALDYKNRCELYKLEP